MPLFDAEATAPFVEQAALQEAFAQPQPESRDSLRLPRWLALLGSNLFDAATTDAALRSGAREANPLVKPFAGNRMALYGLKGGIGLLEALLLDRAAKTHPNVANGVGFGLSGLNAGIGVHNLGQR